MSNSWTLPLLLTIYPVEQPQLQRDRPLQVLALGLSRTGSDSLRQALYELGYSEVYHGYRSAEYTSQKIQWIKLGQAQAAGNKAFLNAHEFDKALGDCEAVTDIPCAGFATDLLRCYPDAKTIVNYREDVDAWYRSVVDSIVKLTDYMPWKERVLLYFQRDLFWQQYSYYWIWLRYVNGDFRKNGKQWYRRHYRELEEALAASDREHLKWKVDDGWEPLCNFLDKPVPPKEFPNGNVPQDFLVKVAMNRERWRKEAKRNLFWTGTICTAAILGAVSATNPRALLILSQQWIKVLNIVGKFTSSS